jgi:SOS-response transcriptional repressor LexA
MYLLSHMLNNKNMTTIDEIHKANLHILAKEFGGVTAVAAKVGCSSSQYSQWMNGSENSGTGKPRGMRPASARRIEQALKKPVGWMDAPHADEASEQFDANVKSVPMGSRAIPVISAIQAGKMKEITQPYALGDGYAAIYVDDGYSPWAFALEIEGDSMTPDYQEGDLVIIEPEWTPRPGECVAARNGKQEATFKKYRQRGIDGEGNDIFELVPLNENYPTVRSDETLLTVIGVMAEHRRKARRR